MLNTITHTQHGRHFLPKPCGTARFARLLACSSLLLLAAGCGLGESASTAATSAAASSAEAKQMQTLPEDYERRIEEAEKLYQRRLEEAEAGSRK